MEEGQNEAQLAWWQTAVVYQLYPRSFKDSDSNGIGDLEGIRSKLDYLEGLGVECLWLSPVSPSPQVDFGYDVADYTAVDQVYGGLPAMKALLADAHARGMKIMMDGVFNHTSDEHEWFKQARSSKDSPMRDFYIWHPGTANGSVPNNWCSNFGGPAWTRDEASGEYFLHSFHPRQPDLNWRNPKVVEAILGAMRWWLELGVDGFRLDVFNCYFKSAGLESNPQRWDALGVLSRFIFPLLSYKHIHCRDQYDEMRKVLSQMRSLVDSFGGTLVGETLDERREYENAPRYVSRDQLQMAFNFRLLNSSWGAVNFLRAIRTWTEALGENGWPTWVVDNHDVCRSATRWRAQNEAGTLARTRLVALLLLSLRGTPYIYQGQEIAMTERTMARKEILDPPGQSYWPIFQGRDGCRTPMQWDSSECAGFCEPGVRPWLPVNVDKATRNVRDEETDEGSTLNAYKAVIRLRKAHLALSAGSMALPQSEHASLLHFTRTHGSESLRIVLNMSKGPVQLDEDWVAKAGADGLLYSTEQGRDATPFATLRGYEGVVLRQ